MVCRFGWCFGRLCWFGKCFKIQLDFSFGLDGVSAVARLVDTLLVGSGGVRSKMSAKSSGAPRPDKGDHESDAETTLS